jgi:hypothetical protein
MSFKKHFLVAVAILAITLPPSAQAEENLWLYTRGTDTRPEGSWEAKLSSISRIDKGSGHYRFDDIRPEVEYGITDSLTVGAELMFFNHDYSVDDPDLNPMYETQEQEGGSVDQFKYAGYEISTKYNFLSPYKDALGLSLGLGYENRDRYRLDGAKIDQDSYIVTLLAQKNFLDDKLTLAANWKTEFERRKSPGVLEEEIAFDISAGVSYRVAPKHFVGLEFRHQSDYLSPYNTEDGRYDDPSLKPSEFDLTSFKLGTQHQHGNYFGPTYHYAEKDWWFTTGALFQVDGGGSQHAYVKNGKNYDEHERVHIGFIFGYNF